MKKLFTEEEVKLHKEMARAKELQDKHSAEGAIDSIERNTVGINYKDFAEDYSEKAYKIYFLDLDGNETSVFIPKSQVEEDGSLPEWLVEAKRGEIGGFDFPFITTRDKKLEKWIKDFSKLEKFVEEKHLAKNLEKRERSISKITKRLEELTEEISNLLEEKKSRLIKK